MSSELDAGDKELLKDIVVFNLEYAATGWHLEDRIVIEDLTRISLSRSTFRAVQFTVVSCRSAVLTDTSFTGAEFHQVDFGESILRNVVFRGCQFLNCSFEKTVLTNCRFIDCHSERLNASGASFEDCFFESFADQAGVFTDSVLRKSRMERCTLRSSAFHAAELDDLSLKSSEIADVVFDGIKGGGLAFEDCNVDACGFVDSHYGDVAFLRGINTSVKFKGFNVESVVIEDAAKVSGLTVRESKWNKASITGCNKITELVINKSVVKDLTLMRCRITYLNLKETEFSAASQISQCRIAGLNLTKSRFLGTQWIDCEIAGSVILDEATFDGVVLTGMSYALTSVRARDVHYLNRSPEFIR